MNREDFSVEMVLQCVDSLYKGDDRNGKERANAWLQQFQKSTQAWRIADELLQMKRDSCTSYIAAQTLRIKIQTSFGELPRGLCITLRNSLIAHVSQLEQHSDKATSTQLCLAITDLILHMGDFPVVINDMIALLASTPNGVWPLLEILTVLPEEADSRHLRLGANRREEILQQFKEMAPKVMEFLYLCLHHDGPNKDRVQIALLRAFSSWISAGAINMMEHLNNPINENVFQLLSQAGTSANLHEYATDCLCSVISTINTHSAFATNNSNCYQSASDFEQVIFNAVCQLEQSFHTSVAMEDASKVMNYCRIFTTLSEAFFLHMLCNEEEPHYSIKSLDLVLICVGHYDYEVAEITFSLWHRLSEELFDRDRVLLINMFRSHIERLIQALYRHAQMESDEVGLIDKNNNFYDFRRKVSDLIKDVAFIVGSSNCFKQMFLLLQDPSTTWECMEAALFVMKNVAKNILPDEKEVVPNVVEAILNMPEQTHIALRYTSILLLGELGDWIDNHPEALDAILNFLLLPLQQQNDLASAAAIALTSISAACRKNMLQHLTGLLTIVENLHTLNVSNDIAIHFLKSISDILSLLPAHQLINPLRHVVSCQLVPLSQLIESDTTPSCIKDDVTNPAYWIDRACVFIRHTIPNGKTEQHPTTLILKEIWPLISKAMVCYQTSSRIMERLCRLLRYGIRMVRRQFIDMVEPLTTHIVGLYKTQRHSCFLYLGSVLVDEFARYGQCVQDLVQMLQQFGECTFPILERENGMQIHSDIVDDFFRLSTRLLECCPSDFLRCRMATTVFLCAKKASSLYQREAHASAMKFLVLLLKIGQTTDLKKAEDRTIVVDIVSRHGQDLVCQLLSSALFVLSSTMFPDVAEVLYELEQIVSKNQMQRFLNYAMSNLPKNDSAETAAATDLQIKEFSECVLAAQTSTAIALQLKWFAKLYN